MSEQVVTVTLNPGLDRTLSVPEIRYNDVLRATDSRLDWGGKGFNVAGALRALDVESVCMGCCGGHGCSGWRRGQCGQPLQQVIGLHARVEVRPLR